MDDVQVPENRLFKKIRRFPIFNSEMNPLTLPEVVKMLTPQKRKVVDPYVGVLSTAMNYLKCSRACIEIEKNLKLFQDAAWRLGPILELQNRKGKVAQCSFNVERAFD